MKHARSDYDRIQDPENKIGKDEPVFLIRASDIAAPQAVEAWANIAKGYGADENIVNTAMNHAAEMREWHFVTRK